MSIPKALAFDLYGTLVDPIRIWQQLEQYVSDGALRVAELWRQKQLEYTFRLAAMEQYEDFEQVTRKALDYALAATGQQLDAAQKDVLMAQYDDLAPFADAFVGLEQLRAAGYTMLVFSNGTIRMIDRVIGAAGLQPFFQSFVSVDEVQTYKPSPKVYHYLAKQLRLPVHEVCLISSNPFDVIGAQAAGLQATWVDRSGGVWDTLAPRSRMVVQSLSELGAALVLAGETEKHTLTSG